MSIPGYIYHGTYMGRLAYSVEPGVIIPGAHITYDLAAIFTHGTPVGIF